jgi:hypothetical protein
VKFGNLSARASMVNVPSAIIRVFFHKVTLLVLSYFPEADYVPASNWKGTLEVSCGSAFLPAEEIQEVSDSFGGQ